MRNLQSTTILASLLLAACTVSSERARTSDTLAARAVTTSSTRAASPASPSSTSAPGDDDSARFSLKAFVGSTAASVGSTLPELAFVATDGRRVGYDPVTKRELLQMPNGDYYTESAPADDDRDPGDTTTPPEAGIDSRNVEMHQTRGDSLTLEVIAHDSGTFLLSVRAHALAGPSFGEWENDTLSLSRGQVRRFLIRGSPPAIKVTPRR